MTKLYGIKNCDSCRAARRALQEHDIDFDFVDVRETRLDAGTIRKWQGQLNWEKLINKRSTTWRQIPAKARDNLTAATSIKLILEHPTVMKRPLLETGDKVLLGFDSTLYKELARH